MTEQWVVFESKINRLKGRIIENEKELITLKRRLKLAETNYEKFQLESNGDEPLEE